MRTIETKLFTYSELSESAKSNARDWYRNSSVGDNFYAESVYDDASEIADIIGIALRQTRETRKDGSPLYTPTIFYSGFWSQGDGACFEGSYQYKPGALKSLRAHIGNQSKGDKELLRIARALQDVQRRNFYRLRASMKHRGQYYHSGCMAVSVSDCENEYRDLGDDESEVTQLMRDFADWIYGQLETAYDWENSDDNVAETIECNGYEFTEEGERV